MRTIRRRDFIVGLGAATWPLGVRAQQPATPVVGFLSGNTESDTNSFVVAPFRRGISEQGYVEGRNVQILYRYPDIQYTRMPELVGDLVGRRVAVIFAFGLPSALAAKDATATIPIVFVSGLDPVHVGLVASFNRPGGNLTGFANLIIGLSAKRLELIHEIVPAAKSIGYLYNPAISAAEEAAIAELQSAARTLGVRLVTAKASTASQINSAFTELVTASIGALIIGEVLLPWRDQIVALAAHHALPAIYPYRQMVDAGGLISYGPNLADSIRLAGTYVGRILKGEKPVDLPVQQTNVEMVLNVRTAKALGTEIPPQVAVLADQVIE